MSRRHDIQDATGRLEYLAGRGTVQAWGSTTPTNGAAGFAPGCIYHNLAGTIGSCFYINTGTFTSATWTNVDGSLVSGGLSVSGVAAGYKLARGETVLGGTNPTAVATGLTTVIAFTATIKLATAPGVGTSILTANITGAAGNVNVYAWKVTSSSDTTLIASTGTESFYWVAVGT